MSLELTPKTSFVKLNHVNLQNTGNSCYNFDSILNRMSIDGIVLVNLNDIISAKWIAHLLMHTATLSSQISSFEPTQWHLISNDDNPVNPDFTVKSLVSKLKEISNRNIEIILYLDVADQINYAYRTKPKDYIFLQFIMNICHLFSSITYEFNKHTSLNLNYFACIQKDGFQLRCVGLKQFILSYITSSVKYISKDFVHNIYLTGIRHKLNTCQMSHHNNTNFLACLASGYKFISMRHLYVLKTDLLPFSHEFNTYATELVGITSHIYNKKAEVIKALKSVKTQAKQFIEKIINVNHSGDNMIIGMNLDMEYDLQIYNGVQSIIDNLKYTPPEKKKSGPGSGLNPFAPIFGGGSNTSMKKDDDESSVTVEFKIVSILDLMADGAEINAPHSLFGSGALQKKSVLTTYIPIHIPNAINSSEFNANTISALNNINIYDKLLNKGIKCKKIIILTGLNLTVDHFKKIVDHLADKKQGNHAGTYEAKYINFDINPYLRCSMAYYNYMIAASNNPLTVKTNANQTIDPFYVKNAALYSRFYNYFNKIRKTVSTTTPATHMTKDESSSTCCTCCKCISRFGVEYHEYKYIPYLDDKVIDFLDTATDIWMPRV